MTKAVNAGIPKLKIEESATKKQAKIDNKEFVIVGVNKFQLNEDESISYLEIDNEEVKNNQINNLKKIKSSRDESEVQKILNELRIAAKEKNKNLLALAVKAARARATLGEISLALEKEFGRYKSEIRSFKKV